MAAKISVEKPSLDLDKVSDKELPDKVPDVFGDDEVEEVLKQEDRIRLESLLKDTEVLLKIGDVDAAKKQYKHVMGYFNKLSVKEKKQYFKQVNRLYKNITHFHSFWRKFKRSLDKDTKKKK